jgi:hypothetical protein
VDEALAQQDSWDGLVLYVERMNTFLDADRGLRVMVMTTREGAETWAEGRMKRSPRVDKLIARAKKDGYLRPDAERSDCLRNVVLVYGDVRELPHSQRVRRPHQTAQADSTPSRTCRGRWPRSPASPGPARR